MQAPLDDFLSPSWSGFDFLPSDQAPPEGPALCRVASSRNHQSGGAWPHGSRPGAGGMAGLGSWPDRSDLCANISILDHADDPTAKPKLLTVPPKRLRPPTTTWKPGLSEPHPFPTARITASPSRQCLAPFSDSLVFACCFPRSCSRPAAVEPANLAAIPRHSTHSDHLLPLQLHATGLSHGPIPQPDWLPCRDATLASLCSLVSSSVSR
jgi:hypothetical protein